MAFVSEQCGEHDVEGVCESEWCEGFSYGIEPVGEEGACWSAVGFAAEGFAAEQGKSCLAREGGGQGEECDQRRELVGLGDVGGLQVEAAAFQCAEQGLDLPALAILRQRPASGRVWPGLSPAACRAIAPGTCAASNTFMPSRRRRT